MTFKSIYFEQGFRHAGWKGCISGNPYTADIDERDTDEGRRHDEWEAGFCACAEAVWVEECAA